MPEYCRVAGSYHSLKTRSVAVLPVVMGFARWVPHVFLVGRSLGRPTITVNSIVASGFLVAFLSVSVGTELRKLLFCVLIILGRIRLMLFAEVLME